MERFVKIGSIAPRHSSKIQKSRMGVGMEKLDRDAFDPEKVYDKVAALGVKWIRLQSGWQKTEKEEGVYDFSWLDGQVDALLARGLIPWLCLCYGNALYDEVAELHLGARTGEIISTCGYFGLLSADFDSSTGQILGEYREKPSYYAYQNLCALFNENVTLVDLPVIFTPKESPRVNGRDCDTRDLIYGGLAKANGARAFVYWNTTDLVTVQSYESTVTLEITGVKGPVHLVDPMDGSIYELPETVLTKEKYDRYSFLNLPVKDYPLVLTFGNFLLECDRLPQNP